MPSVFFMLKNKPTLPHFYYYIIAIPLNYCPLELVKITHVCVALNPHSQLLLNQAPCPDLFLLYTTRSQT